MSDGNDAPMAGFPAASFSRPCERCGARGDGVTLLWLWRAKKFVCPVCAVHESYDDALKSVVALHERVKSMDPFAANDLQRLAQDLRAQWVEQLEGKDPRR